ncbi:hypothetical protein [Sphingosinicella sp.]|uniref:hypothetical protein n=1 Tax=Sphingosinicella sp. TaxID=1917971 RepID=UPI0040383B96
MRTAGFALLGFLGGALAGFALATLVVILWYDALGIGDHGGDGMSGMATFIVLAPALSLIGGIAGAVLLGRKAGEGTRSPAFAVAAALIVLLFVALFGFSGMFL